MTCHWLRRKGKFLWKDRGDQGSAFVLTLMFLLLLTTMSTGLYLYANKQATHADATYSSVAAGYIAQAGIDAGLTALEMQPTPPTPSVLDTDGNGKVEIIDFPVTLPGPVQVGRYHGTDGRQGVGYYTTVIDWDYADTVEFKFRLNRTQNWQSNVTFPAMIPAGTWNKFLPFKDFSLRIMQSNSSTIPDLYEVVSDSLISSSNSGILTWQTDLYYEWYVTSLLNPYADRRYKIEINRTPFPPPSTKKEYDYQGHLFYLLPNDLPTSVCGTCAETEFNVNRNGADAYVIDITNNRGFYLAHIHRDVGTESPVVTIWYYNTISGANETSTLVAAADWTPGVTDLYAVLDFQNTYTYWESQHAAAIGPTHAMAVAGNLQAGRIQLIIDVDNITDPSNFYKFDVSRGSPQDVLDLKFRARSETMTNTCIESHQPYDVDQDCCWYPNYPASCHDLTELWADLMVLNPFENYKDYGASGELNAMLSLLEYDKPMQIDQVYTVTSSGNVEMASQRRQVMLQPVSFLDFSRFVANGSWFTIGPNTQFGGRVYSFPSIKFTSGGDIFFYDNVYTSGRFLDGGGQAKFRQNATLNTHVQQLELPEEEAMNELRALAREDGWYIHSPTGETYLFLGCYDYLGKASLPYGFNFLDPTPLDTNEFAQYIPPPSTLGPEENSYDGYVFPGGSTVNLSALGFPPSPDTFNGVIYVDGDLHIWGKLRGRSLTIGASGNITIEREILMGNSYVLEDTHPEINHPYRDEGYPVHLGLIAGRGDGSGHILSGDIIISETCPRVMKIEAALMALHGVIRTDDNISDYRPTNPYPAPLAYGLDNDRSHRYYYRHYNSGVGQFEWLSSEHPFGEIDINFDGRLEPNFYGWNETDIDAGSGTGDASDTGVYLWYLEINGPIITYNAGDVGFFQNRSSAAYNRPSIERSRNYLYNPSIKYNPPPHFPAPAQSLQLLEWTNVVAER